MIRSLARWAGRRRWLILGYLSLLLASNLFTRLSGADAWRPSDAQWAPTAQRLDALVPEMRDAGPEPGRHATISLLRWEPPPNAERRPIPVILLHGSPSGGALDFAKLAPKLAEQGYTAYALDFPGFGCSSAWVDSYSIIANARYTLAVMDQLNIDRAHIVGWSQGGGSAIETADLAPERVATLTLMGAIGVQEAEGSGDYYFEHAKYALGYAGVVVLPELIPHFGLLGARAMRHGFIRNFWDTDQRPLRDVMQRLDAPTLILQGRRDPLVPAWCAEESHRLIATSRLVMLDASHFFPFGGFTGSPEQREAKLRQTAALCTGFFDRHETAGVPALVGITDFAPDADDNEIGHLGPFELVRGTHWSIIILFIILATFVSEDATVIAVGLLIASGRLDFGVGFIGCFMGITIGDGALYAIGRFAGRPALRWPLIRQWLPERSLDRWGRWFDKHTIAAVFVARAAPGTRLPTYLAAGLLSRRTHHFLIWAGLAAVLWTPALLLIAILAGPRLLGALHETLGGPLSVIAALVVILIAVRIVVACFTWTGRRRVLAGVVRLVRSEYWPSWIFYAPLGVYLAWQAVRRGGPMSFTCLNPGVPHGGGVVGESKWTIIKGLLDGGAGEWVVPTDFIAEGDSPEERADRADSIINSADGFHGYPVILKPDQAQRGHAVKLVRSRDEALEYFRGMTRDAVVQGYHPGPEEVGVLWVRQSDSDRADGRAGYIFSITRKEFPVITGDGKRTIERLIWGHPRYRMQGEVFCKRFADQLDRVPGKGERIRLAEAGNHAQGTKFLDGADLITDELSRRIDEISRDYPGGFDFGRFDIRYASDEELRHGEGFVILELNGTMSESTNMYDPRKSLLWTYRVLFRQWREMYRLGHERRRAGVKPMSLKEVIFAFRDHLHGRQGSAVSD
ncbi:MAG: alpha/beta fold hydrolase [Phycisphaeraceae bacterium]|nr:alpha/beta fold hydrolase [Phycisphaeraceae bacterium]